MLWQLSALRAFDVQATDGRCGRIADFLVDDTTWRVRWIVGDVGSWIDPHKVLLPPTVFGTPREEDQVCPVSLSRQRVAESPDATEELPVAQQMAAHQARPHLDMVEAIAAAAGANLIPPIERPAGGRLDPHLRSADEVTGYAVAVNDGVLGEVDDFLVDDSGWVITNLVIRWTRWWAAHRVVIPPSNVESLDWTKKKIRLRLSAGDIKRASPLERIAVIGRGGFPRRTGWESVM